MLDEIKGKEDELKTTAVPLRLEHIGKRGGTISQDEKMES